MQDALRINDADSVTAVTGNIKLPTGEVGDKNISFDQMKGYTNEGTAAEEHTHEIVDTQVMHLKQSLAFADAVYA